ncbi:MAG: magnesium transporter CorA family protein [Patescibacteria group bacterium]
MAIRTIKTKNLKWINIDEFDQAAAAFLKKNFKFHTLDLKDCYRENIHPKIDSYEDYIFLVLNFPEYNSEKNRVINNELDVFLSSNFVITIQKKRFKALKNSFYRCAQNQKVQEIYFGKNSVYLFYKIIEEIFRSTYTMIDIVSDSVNKIENQLFEKKTSKDLMIELAELRRNILTFRSIIDPQRFTLNTLVDHNNKFLTKEAPIYFDDIHDWIEEVWIILNNYLDISENLYETNQAIISNKTNRVIKVLTIISVALLPLTLLAGIYGMNINGMPLINDPIVILFLFIGILGTIIFSLFYLKKKNWM